MWWICIVYYQFYHGRLYHSSNQKLKVFLRDLYHIVCMIFILHLQNMYETSNKVRFLYLWNELYASLLEKRAIDSLFVSSIVQGFHLFFQVSRSQKTTHLVASLFFFLFSSSWDQFVSLYSTQYIFCVIFVSYCVIISGKILEVHIFFASQVITSAKGWLITDGRGSVNL